MDAKKLEILMTAVDLGSFSRASEVVGYTQSGLTHLVNSLEREIGFPLIIRSHNGIALTEEGRELMPAIRQFLQANANLENQIQSITEKQTETIRIALTPALPCSGCRRSCTASAGSARMSMSICAWWIMRWNHLNFYRITKQM
ncbi:LysR family transcriptional regulator [Clostridium sp. OF09-36]|uniref:LysR family transcriptional regulator n=1 Tax=Clostridium sp. OF09-36 TaxID=2292310 RepID=UPI000E50C1F5|nr:LysR family transcriptional regulator [Clostridium sp. OF09-36]RHV89712.1 LysR family transcriptional regulator [Clostridium sp. OF09-36]